MLSTNVGSVKLKNPLLLASGYITETADFFLEAQKFGCSGIVTRSFKYNPPPERDKTPAPRYAFHPNTNGIAMLNCEWGSSVPWKRWVDDEIAKIRKTGAAVIISLSGREPESVTRLMQEFNECDIDAYEVNVSCSHSGAIHGNLNIDADHLRILMKEIRPQTAKPIWIKLSYSTLLLNMAKIAEENGANAIVCTNSIGPGMLIDTETSVPKLGIMGGAGGVTGPVIFPIALNCVYQLKRTLSIPIVGVGGIRTADDVVQMLMAGASAVQLYTTPMLEGPSIFAKIEYGLEGYFTRKELEVSDIIGITQGKRPQHTFIAPIPTIHPERCIGCGACKNACVFKAIVMDNGAAHIQDKKCTACSACINVCTAKAIKTPIQGEGI